MSRKNKATDNTKKKKKGGKIALSVIGIILVMLAIFVGVTAIITSTGNKANIEKANSFACVEYKKQLSPTKEADGSYTFTTNRDFKILQLTDVHIGGGWMSLKKDAMALNAVAAMVTAEKPDLVIVTGDIAYPVPFQSGTFNNKNGARIFAELMEKLGVYWTLGFGNHDTEAYSYYSRDEIADLYLDEKYAHCIFEKGPSVIDGVGNQIINVKNTKGLITQSLFVFDSHSYTDNDWFGIMWKYDNIHENQVKWYREAVENLNQQNNELLLKMSKKPNSKIKSLAFFHIPLVEQKTAWDEYAANGYKDTENTKLNCGVIGESGKFVYCGMHEDDLFETMLELGSTQGIFFGHDHKNNISFNYKGIDMTYGMSVDYLAYPGIYKLGIQRGCTVIKTSPDGSYTFTPENYYQDKYAAQYEKEQVEMIEVTYANQ